MLKYTTFALLLIMPLFSITSTWISPQTGTWATAQNWNNGVPNNPGDIANIAPSGPNEDISIVFNGNPTTVSELNIQTTKSITFELPTLAMQPSVPGNPTLISILPISGVQTNYVFGSNSELTLNNTPLTFDLTRTATSPGALPTLAIFCPITGTGSLIKTGTGSLSIESSNGFSGPTQVNGGTLIVNGSLASSTLTIGIGGTLSGTGTVGPTTSHGKISPGNSPGTLTINGALTLESTSVVSITLTPSSSSVLNVTGNAHLNGTLTIDPEPGFYGLSKCYTVLHSGNPLTTTFTTAASTNPAFFPTIQYVGNDVVVCEIAFVNFPFSNKNTKAVGDNLIALHASNQLPPDVLIAIDSLVGQSTDAINNAFNQMHPANLSGLTELQAENGAKLISLFHKTPFQQCGCEGSNRFWITPFGSLLDLKNGSMQLDSSANTAGFALGFDKHIAKTFSLGFGGAWQESHQHVEAHRGHMDVEAFYISLYGDYENDRIYCGGALMLGADFYKTNRHIQFVETNMHAKAQYKAIDFMGQLALAYRAGSPNLFISPYGNLDFLYLNEEKFQEQGAGGFDLSVHSRVNATLRAELGLAFQGRLQNECETMCLAPNFSFGWVNMCPLQRATFTSTFEDATIAFATYGWNRTWNLFTAKAGLSFNYKVFSTQIEYQYEFSPNTKAELTNQYANIQFGWQW